VAFARGNWEINIHEKKIIYMQLMML